MSCRGSGVQVSLHKLGPGMVQQVRTVCQGCQGQGQRISHKDRCKACSGRKILRQKKILEVHIDKGKEGGKGKCPLYVNIMSIIETLEELLQYYRKSKSSIDIEHTNLFYQV